MGITVCNSRSKPPQLKPIMKCVVALVLWPSPWHQPNPTVVDTVVVMVDVEDMEAAMAAEEDMVEAMVDTVERERPKPNLKLMLNQKPTPLLKPMLMPMPTMDMVVMVDTEAMEDMVDTDTAVNEEVPMPKLMPTMDMEVVMVDMEVMAADMEVMDTDANEEAP